MCPKQALLSCIQCLGGPGLLIPRPVEQRTFWSCPLSNTSVKDDVEYTPESIRQHIDRHLEDSIASMAMGQCLRSPTVETLMNPVVQMVCIFNNLTTRLQGCQPAMQVISEWQQFSNVI